MSNQVGCDIADTTVIRPGRRFPGAPAQTAALRRSPPSIRRARTPPLPVEWSLERTELLQALQFADLSLLTGDSDSVVDWLVEHALRPASPPEIVVHLNAANYHLLQRDPALAREVRESCHLLMDGIGMKIAYLLQGGPWVPDLNGTDLFPRVMSRACNVGLPVYFLGAEPAVVECAVEATRARFSGIRLVGHHSGYFEPQAESEIVERINASGARLLVCGRGFPRQETFALRVRSALRVAVIWNVGGLFDFVSGRKPRAPTTIRQLRLEWLFRLGLEPRRMWRRTFVSAPWLFGHALAHRGGVDTHG